MLSYVRIALSMTVIISIKRARDGNQSTETVERGDEPLKGVSGVGCITHVLTEM